MTDERTNEEERGHAPIALPANSFELRELEKKLDSAVSVKNEEQHPERINKAIAECAHNKDVLANADRPAIPNGAKLVDQDVVYVEGTEPVTVKGVAFEPVKAESGEEASKMRYDQRRDGEDVVVAEDAAVAVPGADGEVDASTLSGAAAAAVDAEAETAGGRTSAGRSGNTK